MRTKLFLLSMILIVAGCVPSLHSIVTEKTLTYDPAFVGRWHAEDTDWTVTGDPNDKTYSFVIKEKDDKTSLLTGWLVDLQGQRFLDLYPSSDAELNTGDWFKVNILPVHTFWKFDKTDSGYTLAAIDPDNLKKLLSEKPRLVKHEIVEGDHVVLTDSAENLQKFLIEGLKIEGFFGNPIEMKPVKD